MADLILRGISKQYPGGHSQVLKPLNLEFKSGELVVLVGPSGCGKSTLLKIIAGLETPDAGQILLGGRDITALEPRHRRMAMVFQNYALYPHLTVRENLAYPLKRAGVDRATIQQQVQAVSAQLRLSELLDRRPSQLSGGQKQRVAMGRSIIRKPDLFLLDEPLSNLDAALRTHVRGEIRELQQRLGTTMIYVTHDQVEAQTLADRLVIMRNGEVQQVGHPRDIYREPANLFAASMLGAGAPNILLGQLDPAAGAVEVSGARVGLDTLSPELRAAVVKEREVLLAVRPEDLREPGSAPTRAVRFSGKVKRREHIGSTQYVYFTMPGTARASDVAALTGRDNADELIWIAQSAQADDAVTVEADLDKLRFFDLKGQSLGPQPMA